MKKVNVVAGLAIFSLVFLSNDFSFSQPPPSQTVGGMMKQQRQIEKQRKIEKKIETKRPQPKEALTPELIAPEAGPKVKITKIDVEDAKLLSPAEIQKITSAYEGKELSVKEMQKVADLITDEYYKKGYVTSRAYLPPQTIKEGTLTIKILEGKQGNLEIKGNRFFSKALLRRKLNFRPAGYFDYTALQRALADLNELPDLNAEATLVPGKEAGTTDLILQVQDRLPIHAAFQYDNYASRFVGKDRYALVLEDNNLLGLDDKLYFKLTNGSGRKDSSFRLIEGRYSVPVTNTLDLGVYYQNSNQKLGKDFIGLGAKGHGNIYGLFLNKTLVSTDNIDLRLNFGFDYKSVANDFLGAQLNRDEVRVFKGGADLDLSDAWGRTIVSSEVDVGVPDIFGAMASKDPNASRAGAAGKFEKWMLNLYRLQPMPFSSSLLWKNSTQLTNQFLPAIEEFQIGGPTSVRGYAPAEFAGDSGYYTSLEWSCPFYFISKSVNVPFIKAKPKLYDKLRFVVFYDWAMMSLNRTLAGEEKRQTIKGCGFGFRFNPSADFSVRVEIGYPLGDKRPSDNNRAHPWIEFIWRV